MIKTENIFKEPDIFNDIHKDDVIYICSGCGKERLLYLDLGFKSQGGKCFCKKCSGVKK